jgi:ribosomal-protein-alanine N-acetyltransferase
MFGGADWRHGIMTEALGAVLAFGFLEMGLHRVEAVVDDANEPSKGLLRKLVFGHEGTLRQRFHFRDRYWDERYFGLLREEWRR